MAKRGERIPYRVRFRWVDVNVAGTVSRSDEGTARIKLEEIVQAASRQERPLRWSLEFVGDPLRATCDECGVRPGLACSRGLYAYVERRRPHPSRGVTVLEQGELP